MPENNNRNTKQDVLIAHLEERVLSCRNKIDTVGKKVDNMGEKIETITERVNVVISHHESLITKLETNQRVIMWALGTMGAALIVGIIGLFIDLIKQ